MIPSPCVSLRLQIVPVAALFVSLLTPGALLAQSGGFTIEQALSAPFTQELVAAPAKDRLAWVANIGGRRNLWVAEPAAHGAEYTSRQVTHYTEDDGQEMSAPEWTPDAASIVYVRGTARRARASRAESGLVREGRTAADLDGER